MALYLTTSNSILFQIHFVQIAKIKILKRMYGITI